MTDWILKKLDHGERNEWLANVYQLIAEPINLFEK